MSLRLAKKDVGVIPPPRRPGRILAVMAALWAFVSWTPGGRYLNEYLFLRPLAVTRAKLGLAPVLDPGLRVIVVDDRALVHFGALPTFGDWQRAAGHLFDLGYSTVLLHDVFDLPSTIGGTQPKSARGRFVLGAMAYPFAENPRARESSTLPPSLLLPGDARGVLSPARFAFLPSPEALARIDALGALNQVQDMNIEAGYATPDGRVIPAAALATRAGLVWQGGWFADAEGALPRPIDGRFFVDFLRFEDVMPKMLSASLLLEPQRWPVADTRLAGGRIAVLVPESYTGSRFVDSPFGKVPAFMATLSVVNGLMSRRLCYQPLPTWLIVGILQLLAIPLFCRLPGPGIMTLTNLFLAGAALVAAVLFQTLGWTLPVIEWSLVLAGGGLTRAMEDVIFGISERATLRRDLELGRSVQTLLLPHQRRGAFGPWSYEVVFAPHGAMSGDWLQVYTGGTPAAPFALIAIGDVVGKGVSAALVTATIAGVWHQYTERWDRGVLDFPAFLGDLNQAIHRVFKGEQMTALSLAVLREDGVELLSYASPAWQRLSPAGELAACKNPPRDPLGWNAAIDAVATVAVTLDKGDALICFTDGVLDGRKNVGRFAELLQTSRLPAAGGKAHALSELARRAALESGGVQPDDFTLLYIERMGERRAAPVPGAAGDPAAA